MAFRQFRARAAPAQTESEPADCELSVLSLNPRLLPGTTPVFCCPFLGWPVSWERPTRNFLPFIKKVMLRRNVSNCAHELERGQVSSIFTCPGLKPGVIMEVRSGRMAVPGRCLRIRPPSPASSALCENCYSLSVSSVPGTSLGSVSPIIHYL